MNVTDEYAEKQKDELDSILSYVFSIFPCICENFRLLKVSSWPGLR